MPIILMKSTYYSRWNLYRESIAGENFREPRGFGAIRESFNCENFHRVPRRHYQWAWYCRSPPFALSESFNRENPTFSNSRKFSPAKDFRYTVYNTGEKSSILNNHHEWGYCCYSTHGKGGVSWNSGPKIFFLPSSLLFPRNSRIMCASLLQRQSSTSPTAAMCA